ncbi:MAG: aspartate carbamoyltransferase catalytic subunit [Bdellovibrionota bacterium]|nr:MAG: aspartate carbamoyltransferase catalytic subunit [Bdellovibrionota bacterium]
MGNAVRHLLSIEGLTKQHLLRLVNNGREFVEVLQRDLKKVPTLRGKTVINLFLEPSTRTRTSFEIAAKRLSADAVNVSEGGSSIVKGETLLDTALTLQAMAPDILVVRHKESGAAHFLARHLRTTAVVNAGDGMHEHPTQALLDLLTLQQHFAAHNRSLEGLRIAIVGDIRHSRVARSNMWAHALLGNEVRLVGPRTLLPEYFASLPGLRGNISLFHSLQEGIRDVDVVMCLRLQLERQSEFFIPSLEEYSREFGVTRTLLDACAPKAVVLHPGPANRGIEVSSEVLDSPRALMQQQVTFGVAIRMAVLLDAALGGEVEESHQIAGGHAA